MALNRSQQMARIRGFNTGPEQALRRALGVRAKQNRIGRIRPDIVFVSAAGQVAVFVDGCFWHGCPHHYVRPRSTGDFWNRKLRENTDRDSRQTKQLIADGWTVVRIWEHELAEDLERVVAKVQRARADFTARVERWRVVEVTPITADKERRLLRKLLKSEHWRVEEGVRSTRKVGRVSRSITAQGIGGR